MAEAATAFLLESLKEEVFRSITLSKVALSEVQGLEKDLEIMKQDLEKASRKKSGEEFRNIENDLLDVIYEAEDLIDSYITQELCSRKRWRFHLGKIDLAEKIQNLRNEKIRKVFADARAKLKELPELCGASESRKRYNPNSTTEIVGMEDEINKYIAALTREDEFSKKVEAMSIVGMPGLGKTTVASKIFQHQQVNHHFPTKGWINVSQDPNVTQIYKSIIKLFTEKDVSHMDDTQLALKAQEHLSNVKFFLIFDDVWTPYAWTVIKKALPLKSGSGKVLVTTREHKVANSVNPHREEKDLRFLNTEECWKLLQNQVYGEENKWPPELEPIGRQICAKSGGLPLAIVVIGGILLDKIFPEVKREAEWKNIAATAEILLMKDDKKEGLNSIIGLSYDTLPYDLRDCFLYMAICPKDFEMSTWKLKRLWIAEGFIKEDKDSPKTLEEIAEEKLADLITRNLVMVCKKNERGDVKTCRVHDMIREFCKSKASKLLQVISKSDGGGFHPEISDLQKFRRICVHSHVSDFLKEEPKGPNLRSFISFSKTVIDVEATTILSIVKAFNLLRVFEGSSLKFQKCEAKLTGLVHLRYITLAVGEKFTSLPPSFTELVNLQTIVIVSPLREFVFKADIFEMPRLSHVKSNAALIFTLGKKGKISKKLCTLTRLSTESCNDKMLERSTSLRKLGISGDIKSISGVADFRNHPYLKKLKMVNIMTSSDNQISQFLAETKFPPNLEILVLSGTNFIWNYMSVLGRLSKLQTLKIKDSAFDGDTWIVGNGEFLSLSYLEIERCPDLLTWTVADGSFRKLASLCVRNCPKLLSIPSFEKTLKTLIMGNVGSNAVFSGVGLRKLGVKLLLDPGTYAPQ